VVCVMSVNNTLNALEGKLLVVVSFCVFLFEFIFLLIDRVTVSEVQFLKYKHTNTHVQTQTRVNKHVTTCFL
jgi:hypothetical protein